jgi:hypothetical protein
MGSVSDRAALSDEQIRAMFESCMSRLNDYHFVQCMTHSHSARCTCGLHVIKSAIRANFNAIQEAATRATAEACAQACEAQGRATGDGMTFYTATGQCAAACRKVGEA